VSIAVRRIPLSRPYIGEREEELVLDAGAPSVVRPLFTSIEAEDQERVVEALRSAIT
jgi:hypothetical protein